MSLRLVPCCHITACAARTGRAGLYDSHEKRIEAASTRRLTITSFGCGLRHSTCRPCSPHWVDRARERRYAHDARCLSRRQRDEHGPSSQCLLPWSKGQRSGPSGSSGPRDEQAGARGFVGPQLFSRTTGNGNCHSLRGCLVRACRPSLAMAVGVGGSCGHRFVARGSRASQAVAA